jgi:glyoxylase-like metal-dependent hydrolase (beta-lactamase superfamily II)
MSIKIKVITADNPGPTTNNGTNTYIIGDQELIIIDPGPKSEFHFSNIRNYINNRPVKMILITHHHLDHIGLLADLCNLTNANIYLDKIQQKKLLEVYPDIKKHTKILDKSILFANVTIEPIYSPGHASDHFCFRIPGEVIFTGDHIMGWSTTMIRKPDGDMGQYIQSLNKISKYTKEMFLPGHGNKIVDGYKRCEELIEHRNKRSNQILKSLEEKDLDAHEITKIIYKKISKNLITYAELTVEASLDEMIARKLIKRKFVDNKYIYSIRK